MPIWAGRTATPAINGGKGRNSVVHSEFEPLFLNGCSDLLTARFRVRIPAPEPNTPEPNLNSKPRQQHEPRPATTTTLQQRYNNSGNLNR
jgi:hypothetical protein